MVYLFFCFIHLTTYTSSLRDVETLRSLSLWWYEYSVLKVTYPRWLQVSNWVEIPHAYDILSQVQVVGLPFLAGHVLVHALPVAKSPVHPMLTRFAHFRLSSLRSRDVGNPLVRTRDMLFCCSARHTNWLTLVCKCTNPCPFYGEWLQQASNTRRENRFFKSHRTTTKEPTLPAESRMPLGHPSSMDGCLHTCACARAFV